MINVSTNTKWAFANDQIINRYRVCIGENIELTGEDLIENSIYLKEAIQESDSLEFVGCVFSQFSINVLAIAYNGSMAAEDITVYVQPYDGVYRYDEVKLFSGIIEDDSYTDDKKCRKITAYDKLHGVMETDISGWMRAVIPLFPMTMLQFRNALFSHIGIVQCNMGLPFDTFSVKKDLFKKWDVTEEDDDIPEVTAVNIVKNICQINGVFGIMNRDGLFEYRTLSREEPQQVNQIQGIDYQNYNIHNITRVVIQQSDDAKAVGYKIDENGRWKYIVMGNFFTRGLTNDIKRSIAQALSENIRWFEIIPYTLKCNGRPYLEVGDKIECSVPIYYKTEQSEITWHSIIKHFYIMNRTLTGGLALTDVYSSGANKRVKRIISDMGWKDESLEEIQQEVSNNTSDINGIKTDLGDVQENMQNLQNNAWDVVSTPTEPTSYRPKTIYFIQGIVG